MYKNSESVVYRKLTNDIYYINLNSRHYLIIKKAFPYFLRVSLFPFSNNNARTVSDS